MPQFTVVIPVWNKRPHLRRAVESVLAQSCQDFEVIAVNDHSTDGSEAEFLSFSDPRLRLLESGGLVPQGPGSARNVGILAARGQWVSFLDADDAWEPRYLEEMQSLAIQFPRAGVLACAYRLVDEKGSRLSSFTQMARHQGRQLLNFRRYLENFIQCLHPVWTSVTTVRRSVFRTAGLFPDGVVNGEDLDLWFRIMAETSLAWSPYQGATYFDNTVNKLTKFNLHNHYNFLPTLQALMGRRENTVLIPLLKKASNIFYLGKNLPRVKQGKSVGWTDFAGFHWSTTPVILAQVLLLIVLPNGGSRALLSLRRRLRLWWWMVHLPNQRNN